MEIIKKPCYQHGSLKKHLITTIITLRGEFMSKVIVEMEFECEEFEESSYKEQCQAIETVLESGAEATNSYIKVKSIQVN